MTITTTRGNIDKFWQLVSSGKSVALDVHTKTGETRARYTISKTGDEGNGTPPACMTDDWARVATCVNGGEVYRGSER